MTSAPTNPNTGVAAINGQQITGYDSAGHQINIAIQTGTPVQDATTGVWYAALAATIANANTNGQATMANSAPVVLASDEVVPVKRTATAVYSLASASRTSNGDSGDLPVGGYTEIGIDINTTAQTGTNPTIQLFWERKGADGIYYILWQSAVLTAATNTVSTSVGAGMAYNQSLGITGRFRYVFGGSATPGYTFSANVYGK